MKVACGLYERSGFLRCLEYDLLASDILSLDKASGDELVIAYRLDLATPSFDSYRDESKA